MPGMRLQRRHHRHCYATAPAASASTWHRLCVQLYAAPQCAMLNSAPHSTACALHAHLTWMSLQRCHHRRHAARVRHRLCARSAAMRDAEQRSTAWLLYAYLTRMYG